MTFWTARQLRAATGGSWLRNPAVMQGGEQDPELDGLSTDTRAIRPGQVFLALRGERFDAHDYLDSAVGAGASMLIIDDVKKLPPELLKSPGGPGVLRVADTLKALGQIAAAYRRSLDKTKVVAVVGSNGKTTTTKLIHAVLGSKLRGSCSPKSFNNEVGVPLTILAAKPGDQYLICEVGSNHPGETARLSSIVQPDVVVVTSIGRDHMEFFPSLDVVAKEHASMFVDLRPGGLAIVPAGEPSLGDFLKPVPQVLTFGKAVAADLRLTYFEHVQLDSGAMGIRLTMNDRAVFQCPLLGEHNALNALAAVAVARRFGLDEPAIARGLLQAEPAEMRLNARRIHGIDLLVDCYNANPDSMIAAIRTFGALHAERSRRVLIIGDMLEIGSASEAAHLELAGVIGADCPARLLITVGPASRALAERARELRAVDAIESFDSTDEASASRIARLIRPGDAVLLKGSRGMRLERVLAAMELLAPLPSITIGRAPTSVS